MRSDQLTDGKEAPSLAASDVASRPAPREGARPGPLYAWSKWVLDVGISLVLLLLLSPLLAGLAVAIRIDSPGPALFRQRRTGWQGKPFIMFKFRTMRLGAEEERGRLLPLSKHQLPDFKIENDPRVTRLGGFLRRWSMDEIPNLFNVLRGEMTLVGPRPTSWGPESYEPWQLARLTVRPGLTGLWQVMGRGEIDFGERVRLDLQYIQRQSLGVDLWILLRTIPAVLRRQGAY